VQGIAVAVGEHVSGVVPLAGSGGAFLVLAAGVLAQHGDGVAVQGDGAHVGCRFRWTLEDLVAGGGSGSDERQLSVVQVRMALLSAARSVVRMCANVVGVCGWPNRLVSWATAAKNAVTCRVVSSVSRICPGGG
jgi:hypothetical protein